MIKKSNIFKYFIICSLIITGISCIKANELYFAEKRIPVYQNPTSQTLEIVDYLEKKEKVNIVSNITPDFYLNDNFGCFIFVKNEEKEGWVFSYHLKNVNNKSFPKEIIGSWTHSYYKEALLAKDKNIIFQNNDAEVSEKEYWYYFYPFKIVINNSILSYSAGMGGELFYIQNINKNGNKIEIIGKYSDPDLHADEPKIEIYINPDNSISINGWGHEWKNLMNISNDNFYKDLILLGKDKL